MTLQVHPVADLFPMLGEEELGELAADIKARGLLHPVVLDAEGRVLDGRNRLAACERAGVEPTFTTYEGDDPAGYALAVNIARRNLLPKQRYLVVEKARRQTGLTKSLIASDRPSLSRLSEAALVLDWAPDLAEEIIAGAGPSLGDAAFEARDRKKKAQQIEADKRRLRSAAPDLASHVDDDRMSLDDAIAALNAREEKARAEEAERRSQEEAEAARLEAEREEAAERFTKDVSAALVNLFNRLDPDPAAATDRAWDPKHNHYSALPLQAEHFTPRGIHHVASLLTKLADHLDEQGATLL